MNAPHSDPESNWQKLVGRARADAPPPVDVAALRRIARTAEPAAGHSWGADIAALLASSRVAGACVAATAVLAVFGSWQVWTIWQTLPWAQLIGGATGGMP
ncbi:MAG TPA: hypothetical protein VHE61_21630 [Opitutaceae bacterium]|nr:hypothetical protein [Opitutaceae bacterium]